ncbi:DASH family cryptochrome [Aliivibrio finisterrensis]|uniref:Cryptochrome DASH n=2 Tax=Aliivibrio finisterrensis TaxID=511998 RepID=A0A6N6RQ49_9GAMM|nr:DASH family cryptochrome [Aliivibrio finisterrensis]
MRLKMKKALYWFSHDLRLQDNCSLASLLKLADKIAFVYVVDPRWVNSDNYGHKQVGYHRWQLIYQSLQQLNSQLRDHGHQLHILYGRCEQVIVSLVKEQKIDLLGHSQQVGVYEQSHWQKVQQPLPEVHFVSHWDSTLFSPNQLTLSEKNLASFSKFRKSVEKAPIDPYEITAISLESLPQPMQIMDAATAEAGWAKANTLSADVYGKTEHHHGPFIGGELCAIDHVIAYFETDRPSSYKTTRNALDGWDNSTKMSHFLALGNLSARQIWHHLKYYEAHYGANESTYWIGFELLWREYFQWLALQLGSQLYRFQGGAEHEPVTQYCDDRFIQWCGGNTSHPLVNACMKELNNTGYMSNRGRQIVASCLVNELGIDWRFGAAYFQQQLIDHDVASNWGNWQYIAGVGADPRGGRHFNIEKQTQQYDPDGHYTNKWQAEE